ncbi:MULTISPECIES: phosphate regulon sensor histidine kinase PhoR [Snodgrassella]|uniref:phosphate regulon sensor histidine kinase PhoR n=1 Tax=Snodgrassella TaxID=1193515 RepID=UPI0009977813|nr:MULTISPECIES: phosphate regulon sensor histidine kinase PhoR [Snodgrassella]NUE79736.1 phosphate regulon sensor histidine kinase PhoR [Snodgrassella sp. ESL0304]OOX82200.1 phosphate regulon sensor histidine kinase PhoR [Snodgrassella alvi]ORF03390.1 phosphate regulon sensor histidine kinase PhoR [Snodgrassella alvi]
MLLSELRHHLYLILATVIVVVVASLLAGGLQFMLISLCCLFFLWLAGYWYHLFKLVRWLERPKLRNVPQGIGIWNNIFNTLMLQARSRKKRKQKLGVALLRFNRIAETIPEGVLILGQDGHVQWLNHLAAIHLNLVAEQDNNSMLADLIENSDFRRFLDEPATESVNIKLTLENINSGLPRVLNIIRTPFDEQATLIITQDITAAEQLNATRTAFVANVSHELRTPLTVINGFLETLTDMPDLPQEQRQSFIALMSKEGIRMNHLLADLLTLSRLENQITASLRKQSLCLSTLVEQVVYEAEILSENKHHFICEIAADIWIEGIQQDLYNAFSNLLFNAVRYTPQCGTITIRLYSEQDENNYQQTVFQVSDTGPGIAAEHIPHLTERFYRVDSGRSRESGGTGLGLAIAKHALAEHGGKLQIESITGKGSTFSAILPQMNNSKVLDSSRTPA